MEKPLITNIVRGSYVDGPGIRTVVFFKGCPLRCSWCHNPETHQFSPEISFNSNLCARCGECERHCPNDAIDIRQKEIINRDQCNADGVCVEVCGSQALRSVGIFHSADDLLELLLKDKTFYEVSGGGVTFSGGEPLMHIDYLEPLCKALKEHKINITFETCGYFNYSDFRKKIKPFTNYVLFDVKFIDSMKHKYFTGKENKIILQNFKRLLSEEGITVLPRIPLVPGATAEKENLDNIADFFRSLNVSSYSFLTYNPTGTENWLRLGKKHPVNVPETPMSLEYESEIKETFQQKMLFG